MRQPVSFLTQSKFYSPAFNAAIFDGPIRIYFAQYQESAALKLYFDIQEKLKEAYQACRESFRQHGTHIFIMLYPTRDIYEMCFEKVERPFGFEKLGDDVIFGLCEPSSAESSDEFMIELDQVMKRAATRPTIRRPVEEAAL